MRTGHGKVQVKQRSANMVQGAGGRSSGKLRTEIFPTVQARGPIHLRGAAYPDSTHTHIYSTLTLPSLCASLCCRISLETARRGRRPPPRRLTRRVAGSARRGGAAEAPATRMPAPLLKRHHTVSPTPNPKPTHTRQRPAGAHGARSRQLIQKAAMVGGSLVTRRV